MVRTCNPRESHGQQHCGDLTGKSGLRCHLHLGARCNQRADGPTEVLHCYRHGAVPGIGGGDLVMHRSLVLGLGARFCNGARFYIGARFYKEAMFYNGARG